LLTGSYSLSYKEKPFYSQGISPIYSICFPFFNCTNSLFNSPFLFQQQPIHLGGKSITFLGLKLEISFDFLFLLKIPYIKLLLVLASSLQTSTLEAQQETDSKQAAVMTLPPSVLR
jgi:hypothetical protein